MSLIIQAIFSGSLLRFVGIPVKRNHVVGKGSVPSRQFGQSLSALPTAPAVPVVPAWLRACGLVMLALAAYAPVWHAGFIWDDDDHVTANSTLRSLSGLRRIWFETQATPQYYPLVHTTFWCEYHLWGLHPLGYHLTNLLLHAGNALLLWCVLRRLGVPGAWWAAALFAVHPVHVESVAWITERKNVLSTLCYLGSFLAWLRFWPPEDSRPRPGGGWIFYGLALLLFAGALLSKTVTCSLPAAFLLVRWWKQGRLSIRDGLVTAPFFVLGVPLALQTVFLEKSHVGAVGDEWTWSYVERVLIAGRAVWFYAGKLAWPQRLTFIYPRWQICATSWWQQLFPAAVVAVLLALYAWRRRLGRGPLVAVLFFVGTLIPALGFFDVYPMRYSFVADHFQYLASIGLLVLAGAAIHWLLINRSRMARCVAGGSLLALLGALTWQQARVYHDDLLTLWNDTLAKNPGCWMAYTNRGKAYVKLGQAERALDDFTHWGELHSVPNVTRGPAGAYVARGDAYRELGQAQQAANDYTHAIELEPDVAATYTSRGLVQQHLGQLPQAIADYTRAIELKPDSAEPYTDRGIVYQMLGQTQQAISDHTRAIELQPDLADAYANRGASYQQLGQLQQALADFTRAIELKPDSAEAYYNRANVFLKMKQAQAAIHDCTRALELQPDLAFAYGTRAQAYQQLGQLEEAIADYTSAIGLKPDYAQAYTCRAMAYQQSGQSERALQDCTQALALQPNLPVLYFNRAFLYYTLQQYQAASSDIQRGQELGGTPNPELVHALAAAAGSM
jgi:protein O-mannosyl-transferase